MLCGFKWQEPHHRPDLAWTYVDRASRAEVGLLAYEPVLGRLSRVLHSSHPKLAVGTLA